MWGTGLVPGDDIVEWKRKARCPGCTRRRADQACLWRQFDARLQDLRSGKD